MRTIEILIYDGFDELDAVAPFEVLAAAGLRVQLVAAGSLRAVRSAHGMQFSPQAPLGRAPGILIVPGGGWVSRAPAGAWAEYRRGALPLAIRERHLAGSIVAGVCSGVMLLAGAGLLTGRPCVTHHGAMRELEQSGGEVHPEARVVDDGEILTAGGVTSAIDLALTLVERELGPAAATAGAERIEYERRGSVLLSSARAPSPPGRTAPGRAA